MVDQAIFSKDGPNRSSPADTKIPKVIPNIYKLKNRKNKFIPRFSIETPNNGDVKSIAGTKPIKALIKAVQIRDVIISLIFIGEINKFVKFLLQISSKKSILNPMLVLNKKSYSIAQVNIIPTALL
tara:strand:+ start:1696 stop:2073 length:378 start_codon:yes stop_codon:yes gene_type:complete